VKQWLKVIGTIEALGVFLLAILPGFVGLRVYGFAKPPLRLRGALGELGATLLFSALAWTALYLWRGQDLLPVVLDKAGHPTRDRIDAFAELAGLGVLLGAALGVLVRAVDATARVSLVHWLQPEDQGPRRGRKGFLRRTWGAFIARVLREIRARMLPTAAWDRLMTRLANRQRPVLLKVTTRSGSEVLGVFARAGYADWAVDGRGLLLDVEVVRDSAGQLQPVPTSRGVFVPGDEIAVVSVVDLPDEAISSEDDE
jgi:hypothetical protein